MIHNSLNSSIAFSFLLACSKAWSCMALPRSLLPGYFGHGAEKPDVLSARAVREQSRSASAGNRGTLRVPDQRPRAGGVAIELPSTTETTTRKNHFIDLLTHLRSPVHKGWKRRSIAVRIASLSSHLVLREDLRQRIVRLRLATLLLAFKLMVVRRQYPQFHPDRNWTLVGLDLSSRFASER